MSDKEENKHTEDQANDQESTQRSMEPGTGFKRFSTIRSE